MTSLTGSIWQDLAALLVGAVVTALIQWLKGIQSRIGVPPPPDPPSPPPSNEGGKHEAAPG